MIEGFNGSCSKVLFWAVGISFDSGSGSKTASSGLEIEKGVGVMI